MKEQTKNQTRWFMTPIIVYLLIGSTLLYLVYQVERLSEKLFAYSSLSKVLHFKATPWHDQEIWIALVFPLTCPLLFIWALLVLVTAAVYVTAEWFMAEMSFAVQWWCQLLIRGVRFLGRLLVEIWIVAQRSVRAAVSTLISVWRKLMKASRLIVLAIGNHLVTLAVRIWRMSAPVFASVWRVVLKFLSWLSLLSATVYKAVSSRILLGYRAFRRTFAAIGLALMTFFGYIGRGVLTGLQFCQQWLITRVVTVGQYLTLFGSWLYARLGIIEAWLNSIGRLIWYGLALVFRELQTVVHLLWRQIWTATRAIWRGVFFSLLWLWAGLRWAFRRLAIMWTFLLRQAIRVSAAVWRRLLTPAVWFYEGLLAIYRRMATLVALLRQWVLKAAVELWQRLLVPAKLIRRLLLALYTAASQGLVSTWRIIRIGLSWAEMKLVIIWHRLSRSVDLLWGWIINIAISIWNKFSVLLHLVLFRLTLLLNRVRAHVQTLWKTISHIVYRIWTVVSQLWNKLWRILGGAWFSFRKLVRSVRDWLLLSWRRIWDLVYLAWREVKSTGYAVWQWFSKWLALLWNRTAAFLASVWHPIWPILLTASRRVHDAWHQIMNWVNDIRKSLVVVISTFSVWLESSWKLVKTELKDVLGYLSRAAGFWKQAGVHLRQARASMRRSLSAVMSSLSVRLQTLRHQLASAALEMKEQIEDFLHTVRLWLVEMREHTADSIRDIIPHR